MKILYLPLDSRPCHMVFPVQMANWTGAECIVPPAEAMDYFTTPANWDKIHAFLENHFAEADALAISIDQLCYGGLLASREEHVTAPEALERLELLEKLHQAFPEKPIHAFSVILRSTISVLKLSDYDVYQAVTAYSESSDRYEVMHSEADRIRMEEAEAKIPPERLNWIRNVRKRNHLVNLRCLELRRKGVLTSLNLLMEDSQPYGFHRKEQRILLSQMEGISDTFLHNGTDEGGCLSIVRALNSQEIPVAVRWIGREDGHFIARFEDRLFEQNLSDCMKYLNLKEKESSDIVLAITVPPDGQQKDLHESTEEPFEDIVIREMAAEIKRLLEEGKKVYLLDELCANGGLPKLLCAVHAAHLAGYSAWNTATNAMGTILSQIVSDHLAGKTNISFRNERFMDDMIYESVIRKPLYLELIKAGTDPYHLPDRKQTEARINEMYQTIGKNPDYAGVFEGIRSVGEGYMTLPWPRAFEVQAHNR